MLAPSPCGEGIFVVNRKRGKYSMRKQEKIKMSVELDTTEINAKLEEIRKKHH